MDNNIYDEYKVQSDLNREANEYQQGLYGPQLLEQMQQNQAILIEQTNPKKVVENIILRLQGLEKRPDGSTIKVNEPKMNSRGIQNFKYILESYINQNIILSRLDEYQISKIIIQIGDDIIDDLTLNWRAYGIKEKTDLDIIHDTVIINVYMTLNRALLQSEKNWLRSITMEFLGSQPKMQQPKKGGFWDKFRL